MKHAEQIWSAYMESNQQQNENWKSLLAENISFTGPTAQAHGKEAYIETTENFFRMVRGFELKRYVASEDLLTTEVAIKVASPSGNIITLEMAEFYSVSDGKIDAVKVFYDATEFRKAFGMA